MSNLPIQDITPAVATSIFMSWETGLSCKTFTTQTTEMHVVSLANIKSKWSHEEWTISFNMKWVGTTFSPAWRRNCTGMTPKLHRCYTKTAPVLNQNCTGVTPKLHRCYTKIAPVLLQNCTSITPKLHQCYTKIAPVLHWNCTGVTPKLHWYDIYYSNFFQLPMIVFPYRFAGHHF